MKNSDETANQELTKLTKGNSVSSVSSDSANAPYFSLAPQPRDPAAWAESFHRWMIERCAFRARGFGRVESLHLDFCSWSSAHQEEPVLRVVFVQLLTGAGLFQANGLVSGLVLREELEAMRSSDRRQKRLRNSIPERSKTTGDHLNG